MVQAAATGSTTMAWGTQVPWGPEGSLALALPEGDPFDRASFEVVWPDTSSPLGDYAAALEKALDSPIGAATLEEQVAPDHHCDRRR